jgi:DNA-directed RNA polymerase specialized sigma24 family protein
MAESLAFEHELVGLVPHLRALGRWLCGDPIRGDDLAQDAMASIFRQIAIVWRTWIDP